jgi:DNA-binding transcriptional regulator YiaG
LKQSLFDIEMTKAEVMGGVEKAAYWTGYKLGLQRRFYGETFGSRKEHDQRMVDARADDAATRERGQGYRDGYLGVVDLHDPANGIPILRKWRDWSVDRLAEKAGVSPETVKAWEVGRNPSTDELRILETLYAEN